MANAVIMPKAGITVESCIIGAWEKKVGDTVKVGDILFTYETDKASFECESTEEGTLLEIFFNDGDEVPCLVNVCAIGAQGDDCSALRPDGASQDAPAQTEAPKAEKPKKEKKNRKDEQEIQEYQTIPESPTKIEAIKLIDESPKGEFRFSLSRQMYSLNGVPFVYSAKGETYANIARTFGLFPKEILKFNDLPYGTDMHRQLTPGTLIYIQPKKNEAARGLEKHVLEAEDNLWAISQRYGVKLAKLYKMNGIDVYYVPREGDIIRLRKSR